MQKILIAEDDAAARRLLITALLDWGYDVIATSNGAEAIQELTQPEAPRIALLDWGMPEMSGIEVTEQIRARAELPYTYILILTGKSSSDDATKCLAAGADDFVGKPYDLLELQARIKVGERIIALEQALATKVTELELALAQVKQLKELLPICMFCKKIRDDNDYWHQIEVYIHERTGTDFSHGICPDCVKDWRSHHNAAGNPAQPL